MQDCLFVGLSDSMIPFYEPHMVPDFVLAFLAVSGRWTHPCSRISWPFSQPFWTCSAGVPEASSAPKWPFTRAWPAPGRMLTALSSGKVQLPFWTPTPAAATHTLRSRWSHSSAVHSCPSKPPLSWRSTSRMPITGTAGATRGHRSILCCVGLELLRPVAEFW